MPESARPAYGERSEDVRCPKHDKPLALLEDGVLNGTRVTYWGQCPVSEARRFWGDEGRVTEQVPCPREVRVEEITHTEPSLFGGGADA